MFTREGARRRHAAPSIELYRGPVTGRGPPRRQGPRVPTRGQVVSVVGGSGSDDGGVCSVVDVVVDVVASGSVVDVVDVLASRSVVDVVVGRSGRVASVVVGSVVVGRSG